MHTLGLQGSLNEIKKINRLLFAVAGIIVAFAGCGEPYRSAADQYMDAAQTALIARGVCSSPPACSAKELLFWNEGKISWIFFLKK
jgi:hypothetical protein